MIGGSPLQQRGVFGRKNCHFSMFFALKALKRWTNLKFRFLFLNARGAKGYQNLFEDFDEILGKFVNDNDLKVSLVAV